MSIFDLFRKNTAVSTSSVVELARPRGDSFQYSAPWIWSTEVWTPSKVSDAIIQANSGDLTLAADLVSGLLKEDDRIGGAMQQRRQGLIGLPTIVQQGSDKRNKLNRIEKALLEDLNYMIPENELTNIVEWAVYMGFVPVEAVVVESPISGRRVPSLRAWNPRFTRYRPEEKGRGGFAFGKGWEIETHQLGWIPMNLDDPKQNRWYMYCPFGKDRPWNEGVWRRLAYWALAKRYAMRDWARYSEMCGFPTWVLEAQEGWSLPERKKAAGEFIKFGREKAVGLPKGVKASVLEVQSQSWQGFQQLIGEANLAAIIAIMGQNLTSEVTQGSRASTEVHARIANDLLASDASRLAQFLHDGPIAYWTYLNFGKATETPWVRWDTTPPLDAKTKAETEKIQAETAINLSKSYQGFDAKVYLVERCGLPWKDGDDGEFSPPVPPKPDSNKPTASTEQG